MSERKWLVPKVWKDMSMAASYYQKMMESESYEDVASCYSDAKHFLRRSEKNFNSLLGDNIATYPGNHFGYTRLEAIAFVYECFNVLREGLKTLDEKRLYLKDSQERTERDLINQIPRPAEFYTGWK